MGRSSRDFWAVTQPRRLECPKDHVAYRNTSWKVGSVDLEPDKALDAGLVYEAPFDGPGNPPTRHLTGFVRESCRCRVSMPLVLLDPLKRLALNRSGHVYSLADPPGMNSDAL